MSSSVVEGNYNSENLRPYTIRDMLEGTITKREISPQETVPLAKLLEVSERDITVAGIAFLANNLELLSTSTGHEASKIYSPTAIVQRIDNVKCMDIFGGESARGFFPRLLAGRLELNSCDPTLLERGRTELASLSFQQLVVVVVTQIGIYEKYRRYAEHNQTGGRTSEIFDFLVSARHRLSERIATASLCQWRYLVAETMPRFDKDLPSGFSVFGIKDRNVVRQIGDQVIQVMGSAELSRYATKLTSRLSLRHQMAGWHRIWVPAKSYIDNRFQYIVLPSSEGPATDMTAVRQVFPSASRRRSSSVTVACRKATKTSLDDNLGTEMFFLLRHSDGPAGMLAPCRPRERLTVRNFASKTQSADGFDSDSLHALVYYSAGTDAINLHALCHSALRYEANVELQRAVTRSWTQRRTSKLTLDTEERKSAAMPRKEPSWAKLARAKSQRLRVALSLEGTGGDNEQESSLSEQRPMVDLMSIPSPNTCMDGKPKSRTSISSPVDKKKRHIEDDGLVDTNMGEENYYRPLEQQQLDNILIGNWDRAVAPTSGSDHLRRTWF